MSFCTKFNSIINTYSKIYIYICNVIMNYWCITIEKLRWNLTVVSQTFIFFIHFKKHKNTILLLNLATNIGFTNTTDINWTVRNDKQITYKISYLLNYTNVFVYLSDICIWDDRNLKIWNEDRSFHSSFDMNKLALKGYIYICIYIHKNTQSGFFVVDLCFTL